MNKDANNVLVTKEDLLKEQFNKTSLEESKSVTEFLLYFTRILHLGVIFNIISEDIFNLICNMITKGIKDAIIINEDDEFADNSIQIANYMYVITLYLLEKSNWDAWCELKEIDSKEKAKTFIFNVKKWMENQITKQLFFLDSIKESVKKLNVSNITNCYLALKKVLLDFSSFDNVNSNLNLKHHHVSLFIPGTYLFLVNDFENLPNFYYKICGMIHNFRIEVSIMAAINAGNVFNAKNEEAEAESLMLIKQRDALDNKYQKMLQELFENHKRNLKRCINPKTKEDKALDEVILERRYNDEKLTLEDEWDRKVKELEEVQIKKNEVMFEILSKDYSLEDIIKEYAIFSLAKKGKIIFPSNAEERAKMLMSIKLNVAIEEFIQNIKLNDEQVEFLKKAIT